MGSLIKPLARLFNPLAKPLAASGLLPIWGLVIHRGRRSGRSFATPIALGATADAFYIPLPWGRGTDWCRNLVAAGGGVVRYRGHDERVSAPRIVTAADAVSAFPGPVRPLIPLVRIREFLWVHRSAMEKAA